MLPLHVAVAKHAPSHVILAVAKAYPEAAKIKCPNGKLPLHYYLNVSPLPVQEANDEMKDCSLDVLNVLTTKSALPS